MADITFDEFMSDSAPALSPLGQKIRDKGERSGSNATSPAGAQGRMQLMPNIQKAYGVTNPASDAQSYQAADRFLADTINDYRKMYPGHTQAEYEAMAAAHYNGGWKAGKAVAEGRVPPQQETRDYIGRVNEISFDDFMSDNQASPTSVTNPNTTSRFDIQPEIDKGLKYSTKTGPRTHTTDYSQNADIRSENRVGVDAAIRGATAGIIQPGLATPEERAASPNAELLGNVVGVLPWTMATGGASLPAQMGVLGGRGAMQTALEGGSLGDVATSGALEAAAPGVGAVAGKVTRAAINPVKTGINKMYNEAFRPGSNAAQAAEQASKEAYNKLADATQSLMKRYAVSTSESEQAQLYKTILANTAKLEKMSAEHEQLIKPAFAGMKTISTAAQNDPLAAREILKNVANKWTTGVGSAGGLYGYLTADNQNDDLSRALKFGIGSAGGKVLALQGLKAIIQQSPEIMSTIVKRLPKSDENLNDYAVGQTQLMINRLKQDNSWNMLSPDSQKALKDLAYNSAKSVYNRAYKLSDAPLTGTSTASKIKTGVDNAFLLGAIKHATGNNNQGNQ